MNGGTTLRPRAAKALRLIEHKFAFTFQIFALRTAPLLPYSAAFVALGFDAATVSALY